MPVTDGGVVLYVSRFRKIKDTPKGVWLEYYDRQRFVLLTARKKFAHPTIEEAKESFRARKHRQISILRGQLRRVEKALAELDRPHTLLRGGWPLDEELQSTL